MLEEDQYIYPNIGPANECSQICRTATAVRLEVDCRPSMLKHVKPRTASKSKELSHTQSRDGELLSRV